MKETLSFVSFLCCIFLVPAIVMFPFVYLGGRAKSNYLLQAKGVDIPWHEAAFLDVTINSVDAEVVASSRKKTE